MKALILKISLAVALSFGVTVGFAQQDAVQPKSTSQSTKVESVKVKETKALAPVWFRHVSGPYNDVDSYEFLTNDDGDAASECPSGSAQVCAIKVEPDGEAPNATALAQLQGEINTALSAPAGHTTNVRLKNP